MNTSDLSLVSADRLPFEQLDGVTLEPTSNGVRFTYPDVNGDPYQITKLREPLADGTKYLCAPGSGGTVWRPVANPRAPKVLLVEGTKQHLAAALYAPAEYEVLGIQGCYGWRQEGYETPDLGVIDGRPTVIAFDADVATNHQVHDATALIRDTLEARGVQVSFLFVGAGTDGLDDLLAKKPVEDRKVWLAEKLRDTKKLAPMKAEMRRKSEQKRREKEIAASGLPVIGFDPEELSRTFARTYHHTFRFDLDQDSWASFDGRRWNPGGGNREAYGRIFHHGNNEVAFKSDQREPRMNDMLATTALKLAMVHPLIKVRGAEWDTDPKLWNTPTATVHLDNLAPAAHSPEDLITRISGCDYDATARAPQFEKFISEVLPDPDTRAFVQRVFGMSLLGEVLDHVFVVFTGTGRNGKGVLCEIMQSVFGDYATGVNTKLLSEQKFEGHSTELMTLRGRRLAIAQELPQNARWNVARVKSLTGGDRITARGMRENEVTFKPSHTLIVTTNHKPHVDAGESAFWNRYREVPFTESFVGREDPHLAQRIIDSELPGVLNWILAGLRAYLTDGKLLTPDAVNTASHESQRESDPMVRFFDDTFVRVDGESVTSSDVFDLYTAWCALNDETPLSKQNYRATFELATGIRAVKSSGVMTFRGVGLKSDEVLSVDAPREHSQTIDTFRGSVVSTRCAGCGEPQPTVDRHKSDPCEHGVAYRYQCDECAREFQALFNDLKWSDSK